MDGLDNSKMYRKIPRKIIINKRKRGTHMTYEYFKNQNNMSKNIGVQPIGKIESVDNIENTCVLLVEDNRSIVPIQHIINDIVRDGIGCLSNPSKLKRWKGWEK